MKKLVRRVRKQMFLGFAATIPTVFFWFTVAISKVTGYNELTDMMIFYGKSSYMFLTIFFPMVGIAIAIRTRSKIESMESHSNLYRVESNNRRVNNILINWCVILLAMLVVALFNDI